MSGRASGRHGNRARTPEVDPNSPVGHGYGLPDKDIPGGEIHVVNPETVQQKVPKGAPLPEFRGIMAHGVVPETYEHIDRRHPGKAYKPVYAKVEQRPAPVPVVIVETEGGPSPIRSSSPRSITLPAAGGEPAHICSRDGSRSRVLLLNESTSSDIRFASTLGALTAGTGALLPWPGNSYLTMHTQDDLFAISADSGTPRLSVIEEYEIPGAG